MPYGDPSLDILVPRGFPHLSRPSSCLSTYPHMSMSQSFELCMAQLTIGTKHCHLAFHQPPMFPKMLFQCHSSYTEVASSRWVCDKQQGKLIDPVHKDSSPDSGCRHICGQNLSLTEQILKKSRTRSSCSRGTKDNLQPSVCS